MEYEARKRAMAVFYISQTGSGRHSKFVPFKVERGDHILAERITYVKACELVEALVRPDDLVIEAYPTGTIRMTGTELLRRQREDPTPRT
jgi:hypothetical protein